MAVFISGSVMSPLLLNDTFSANTWKDIIKACQMNVVPESWAVGDSKMMTIDGVDYQIDIIGKNHDIYSDGTGYAPLTFQLHDCYATKYVINGTNTNRNGWTTCDMRSTHLPAILALMPSEVVAEIREVNKLTSAGAESATITTTADKLFLLSEVEVSGLAAYSKLGEGTQYRYYEMGISRIKNVSGTTSNWWTRSPQADNTASYVTVNQNGASGSAASIYDLGVSFAFCF